VVVGGNHDVRHFKSPFGLALAQKSVVSHDIRAIGRVLSSDAAETSVDSVFTWRRRIWKTHRWGVAHAGDKLKLVCPLYSMPAATNKDFPAGDVR
jgi:hypothetical protein